MNRWPLVVIAALLVAAPLRAAEPPVTDPLQYLEEVDGAKALEWVRTQNARALDRLTHDPRFAGLYDSALAIAQDQRRIPQGSLRDGWIYNFWQDADHVRGIWRRAKLASYRDAEPAWETLLDVDELARRDGKSWVWKGSHCQPVPGTRCLVQLSEGGQDASIGREFDIATRQFVIDGFSIPEAKYYVTWQDPDTLLLATDWGPQTLTESGYPSVVKRWSRGTPMASAVEVFRGRPDDVLVATGTLHDEHGATFSYLSRAITFFTGTVSRIEGTRVTQTVLPLKATPRALQSGQLVFSLEQDWSIAGHDWKSGALLSMAIADATSPRPTIHLVSMPGARDAIEQVDATRSGLLVASYSNVRGRLRRFGFDHGRWIEHAIALPDNGAVSIVTTEEGSDTAFVTYENYLQPATLYEVDAKTATTTPIKHLPSGFDSSGFAIDQFEAVSRDGTHVPYFVMRAKTLAFDGNAPTLLYGYGGFQVSMLPTYSATVGKLWLEQGGVYVMANIRGGGEFGPSWHQAGLKTHRQVVYDDFIAIAEDLIARKITSKRRLGIEGGSNGGLLMGVMLTQRPDLFNAAVVQVPLLDMLRFDQLLAGASWVDEYGSPSVPDERAWLETMSPYQNLRKRDDYPVPFLLTSTRDDRVHPGHARKYAAKLEQLGMPFLYYENIEGGHSAAANLQEAARRRALEYTYLLERLAD